MSPMASNLRFAGIELNWLFETGRSAKIPQHLSQLVLPLLVSHS